MLTSTDISLCFWKKKKNATSNSKQSHIQLWAEPVTKWAVWRCDPPLLLTSLSNSWIRVTFPVLESTRKYSAVPFSKVSPYLTGSPSGSVPFNTYTCVPEQDKDRILMLFFFPSVLTNITVQKLLRWLARSSDVTAMISLPHLCMSHLRIALSQRLKFKKKIHPSWWRPPYRHSPTGVSSEMLIKAMFPLVLLGPLS